MKIYSLDRDWQGLIVVVANTRDEGIEIIRQASMYGILYDDEISKIEEHDITVGLKIINYGDS